MSTRTLPTDFLFGTATASYQVEGAVAEAGRGVSIWDTFSRSPGAVRHGHTGDVASDQYHRYTEDIALMHELGVDAYRFSIAWPRILPLGTGRANDAGLDYYKRLIDALLAADIQPAVTLYHWDLPQPVQDAGGWPARETAQRFADYAHVCFKELGDRVAFWITLNEPWCSAFLGHESGEHAPGITDTQAAYRSVHHLNLAHGLAVQAFRSGGYQGTIGITLNMSTPRPATARPEDATAADRAADRDTRMFVNPLFGRGYPQRHLDAYPEIELPIADGDMDLIGSPIDFLGVNYYREAAVAHDDAHPEGFREVPVHQPTTEMGWPIVPRGLYRHLLWLREATDGLPLYITENGCAMPDALSADGTRVHDHDRIDYLRAHLRACADAIEAGVNLRGYFLWSFIDNFEWAHGYTKRFGVVYCDYLDQRRVPKDSYYFYREVIAGHEEL